MAIVSLVTIHPNPGVAWDDLQKLIKKANDISRKHGAENVTTLVTVIGGSASNTISVLSTAADWARFGEIQQALANDPEEQANMIKASKIATWETYVCQTIPDL